MSCFKDPEGEGWGLLGNMGRLPGPILSSELTHQCMIPPLTDTRTHKQREIAMIVIDTAIALCHGCFQANKRVQPPLSFSTLLAQAQVTHSLPALLACKHSSSAD